MAELHCGNIPRYDDYPSLWTDTAGSGETLPMNCLTWFEAFAFCAWDGGRLPTEAEWDYAAAGGAEQRQYPWWPAHHHEELDFAGHVNLTRPKPVGSSSPATDGKWGHSDLAGNVEEWTLDLFADYYANGPGSAHGFPVPCVDCANLASPRDGERVFRLTRGGYGEAISSATSDRIPHTPSSKGMFPLSGGLIGARCARAASEP
jgi:formylglycine-generating enzyme required for sulfatase activity